MIDAIFAWWLKPREFSNATVAGSLFIGFWLRARVDNWLAKQDERRKK